MEPLRLTGRLLDSGGASGKSQETKQRSATKRDANAAMERSARGAVASVTVGGGCIASEVTFL